MPVTILTDKDVSQILHALTKEDVLHLQQIMADALHWYSTSSHANDCCSDYQPQRTIVNRRDGSTTLFMPASAMSGQGFKVVNVAAPEKNGLPNLTENLTISSTDSGSTTNSITPSTTGSTRDSATTSSSQSMANTSISSNTSSSLPTTISETNDESGSKALSSTSAATTASSIRGSLLLLDGQGNTTGLINAEEVTAFRTALVSTMLFKKRNSVHDLTVFGAGKQAYWHIRLALLLRGDEVHHLNIITRNFDSAQKCVLRLYNPQPDDPDYENPIGSKYNSKTKKNILTPIHTEYERLLKEYVRASNVIFCTTPSTEPLFPATHLTNRDGRHKGRYIVCIGSYKPHMIELHPDVIRNAVAPHHEHRHFHKRQREGGAIVVDTVTGCLKEAGEVIQAKLMPDQVVELGELFMLKRDAERRMREQGLQVEEGCFVQDDSGMKEWLTRGNVIYKSVGLGLMDVVVGNYLVDFAREKGIGVTVQDF